MRDNDRKGYNMSTCPECFEDTERHYQARIKELEAEIDNVMVEKDELWDTAYQLRSAICCYAREEMYNRNFENDNEAVAFFMEYCEIPTVTDASPKGEG